MHTVHKVCALILVFIFLFCCCAVKLAGTAASDPVNTTLEEPTAGPSHYNEKGPFDDAHYEIGLKALQAIDGYLDGDLTLSGVNKILSECYDELGSLPELPETDPLYAGNDFVHSYVFLAYVDFYYQISETDSERCKDRNYLAAAIGEAERDFSSVYSSEAVSSFLDGLFDSLEESFPNSTFRYSWYEGDLFIDFVLPSFDYYYQNKDTLSAEDRATVLETSHGYVSGDFAQTMYDEIRKRGGYSFDVYMTLCGCALFCSSCNLKIYMDPLNE